MVSVRIGDNWERNLNDISESEIIQQINRRRAEGQPVCVRVTITTAQLNMILSTPDCTASGGAGRPPSTQEQEIFDLWARRHLNNRDFTGGNLIAFLQQLRRF